MNLYLVRHGKAVSEEENPQRPLSAIGREETERVGTFLGKAKAKAKAISVEAIYHSGKLRAQQTAEILGGHIASAGHIQLVEGLTPKDKPSYWVDRLVRTKGNIMLVGHLPHLGLLTGKLLGCPPNIDPVRYLNAAIVHLVRSEGGQWQLAWIVTPDILA